MESLAAPVAAPCPPDSRQLRWERAVGRVRFSWTEADAAPVLPDSNANSFLVERVPRLMCSVPALGEDVHLRRALSTGTTALREILAQIGTGRRMFALSTALVEIFGEARANTILLLLAVEARRTVGTVETAHLSPYQLAELATEEYRRGGIGDNKRR